MFSTNGKAEANIRFEFVFGRTYSNIILKYTAALCKEYQDGLRIFVIAHTDSGGAAVNGGFLELGI